MEPWQTSFLYKLSKRHFSGNLIKLTSSEGSILAPTLYNLNINDAPKSQGSGLTGVYPTGRLDSIRSWSGLDDGVELC
jgi:hypothetical protein